MNEQSPDPVFDSLMVELLTGQHPPDLSSKIISAWREEQNLQRPGGLDSANQPSAPLVKATPIAPPSSPKNSTPHTTVRTTVRPNTQKQERWSRNKKVAFWLATCAAGLLALVGWFAMNASNSQLANVPEVIADKTPADANSDKHLATLDKPLANGGAEVLELDNLPFKVSRDSQPDLNNQLNDEGLRVEPITSQQVVAQLDQLFEELWSKLGVVPNPNYELRTQAQRLSQTLTGVALSDSQTDWWSGARTSKDLLPASLDTANNPMFAQRWGNLFASLWLARAELSADRHEFAELESFVASNIAANRPWNEVMSELLSSEPPSSEADSASAQSHLAFMTALAGGENHRLVEQIGINFLDANLSCVRCHDANSNPSRSTEVQETYWSLVAMLKGIDVQLSADGSRRNLVDQQRELFADGKSASVFFDLPNGVLKASSPRLPSGQHWSSLGKATPRQALADWISHSRDFDRSSVNQVWKLVFGRPLVPYSAGLENAALAERTAILEFLATQFQAHDHDLKLLVSWIVNSRPYAVQPINLNKSEWLAATDAELDLIQLSELVFAAGPSLGRSPEAQSLESSLAAAVEWNKKVAGEYRAMLAQPASLLSSEIGNAALPPAPAGSLELPSLGYAIHGERQTLTQRNFVNRLMRAPRLSWEERVEHVVGLSGTEVADSRVQHLAKILLEQNSGDAKSTLLRLLWAVQNSDAG